MKALLLVAHGSRREESNDEVRTMADKLNVHGAGEYQIIHSAFLELADPLIPEGIKRCIDAGASSVVVLPYFLNSGRHVAEDIPRIVNDAINNYPDIDITLSAHLGASVMMMDLLISTAELAK